MTPWGAIIEQVGEIADDLITTDEERQKLALEHEKIDASLAQGQINTNIAEAGHKSLFVAGWRPAAGWVAAIALGLIYIPKAIVMTAIWTAQCWHILNAWAPPAPSPAMPVFPELGAMDLIGLLMALLGMARMRSMDKERKVATMALAPPAASGG